MMERMSGWYKLVALAMVVGGAFFLVTQIRMAADDRSPLIGAAVDPVAAASERIVPLAAGTNLPPAGRSLFDQLARNNDGSGWRIPFPFSKLRSSLARAGRMCRLTR